MHLLGHNRIITWLVFQETAKLFSKQLDYFSLPPATYNGSDFFHIPANTSFWHLLILAILVDVQ
jgi:hypothetical protein